MKEGDVKVTKGKMVKPQYRIFKPGNVGSFEEQWKDCFEDFELYLTTNPNQKAFVARVFIAAATSEEYSRHSSLIEKQLGAIGVPYSVLAESPESPDLVMIEAGFVNAASDQVEYGLAGTVRFCRINTSGYNEYWLAGVDGGNGTETIGEKAHNTFDRLLQAFLQLGIGFNSIFRQWNYVERIFDFEQIEDCKRQNYQLFNEARGAYYSKYRTGDGFPAATGIGTAFNGVTIECMAVTGDERVTTIAINNPKQLNSYKYGQEVLKGDPQKNSKQNQPPQFERARLMTDGQKSRLFISGTASIIGQETIGIDDVEKQTRVTIENIALLASESNLKSHYPELKSIPDKYTYLRVYVRNSADIPLVKAICQDYYGEIPISFVEADICRDDLLVEIEAEMVN